MAQQDAAVARTNRTTGKTLTSGTINNTLFGTSIAARKGAEGIESNPNHSLFSMSVRGDRMIRGTLVVVLLGVLAAASIAAGCGRKEEVREPGTKRWRRLAPTKRVCRASSRG